jgi:hypothetical protein
MAMHSTIDKVIHLSSDRAERLAQLAKPRGQPEDALIEKASDQFGDIDEPFYSSLESVLDDLAKRLKTSEGAEMYPRFRERLLKLARMAGYIGWGYGDAVTDAVEELEAILGQR